MGEDSEGQTDTKGEEYTHLYGEQPDKTSWLCRWRIKRRFVVAILAFFGFVNVYMLRVNLSVAVVAMTTNKTRGFFPNGTEATYPDFDWDSKTQGLILASFFYGYIFTQIPGGYFAIWSRWAPPLEQSRITAFAFSGMYMGTVFCMPLSGILAQYVNWEAIFYVFGLLALVWCLLWWICVEDSPDQDRKITEQELEYLQNTIGLTDRQMSDSPPPWRAMLTSKAVWAIIIAHFTENWADGDLTGLLDVEKEKSEFYSYNEKDYSYGATDTNGEYKSDYEAEGNYEDEEEYYEEEEEQVETQ